jgi:hypothetical protein
MIKKTFSTLKMGLWNVGGLISKQFNKTTDAEFLRKNYNLDLLFLVETHLGPDHNISKIGSYYCNLICRPTTKANNRYFGGLAILCKQSIKPHIKNSNPNYKWVKLEKRLLWI